MKYNLIQRSEIMIYLSTEKHEGIGIDRVVVCSMGTVVSIPDTLITVGETLTLPINLDNPDVTDANFQAVSSNQQVLPDENISILGNTLEITSSPGMEGETEITVFSPDYCINETTFMLTVARVTGLGDPEDLGWGVLYPNPAKGYYHLKVNYPVVELRLYSLDGKENFFSKTLRLPIRKSHS